MRVACWEEGPGAYATCSSRTTQRLHLYLFVSAAVHEAALFCLGSQVALTNHKLEDLVGTVKAIDTHGVVLTDFVTVDETGGVVVGPSPMSFIPLAGVVYIWPTDDDEDEGGAAKKARTE